MFQQHVINLFRTSYLYDVFRLGLVGVSVDEGISYFQSTSEIHGLVPKPEHYACAVDILWRSGLLSCTRRFVEEMSIQPGAMVWRTLLSACIVHKNIDIGEFAASHLLELDPKIQ